MNPNEIITNGQEFQYWDNERTQPNGTTENEHLALNKIFASPPQNQPLTNGQPVANYHQKSFTQPPIQQQQQPSLSLPGSSLSLVIETETARLRITFEPK